MLMLASITHTDKSKGLDLYLATMKSFPELQKKNIVVEYLCEKGVVNLYVISEYYPEYVGANVKEIEKMLRAYGVGILKKGSIRGSVKVLSKATLSF